MQPVGCCFESLERDGSGPNLSEPLGFFFEERWNVRFVGIMIFWWAFLQLERGNMQTDMEKRWFCKIYFLICQQAPCQILDFFFGWTKWSRWIDIATFRCREMESDPQAWSPPQQSSQLALNLQLGSMQMHCWSFKHFRTTAATTGFQDIWKVSIRKDEWMV